MLQVVCIAVCCHIATMYWYYVIFWWVRACVWTVSAVAHLLMELCILLCVLRRQWLMLCWVCYLRFSPGGYSCGRSSTLSLSLSFSRNCVISLQCIGAVPSVNSSCPLLLNLLLFNVQVFAYCWQCWCREWLHWLEVVMLIITVSIWMSQGLIKLLTQDEPSISSSQRIRWTSSRLVHNSTKLDS